MSRSYLLILNLLMLAVICPATSIEIAVDNDSGAPGYIEQGLWTTSASPGYNGGTYRYCFSTEGNSTHSATWTPDLPAQQVYEVIAVYREGLNRSTSVPYTITHANGSTVVYLDQYGSSGMVEKSLGEFIFDAGTSGSVTVSNDADEGYIISDTIIWKLSDDPPVITNVEHSPEYPGQTDEIVVSAKIIDDSTVASASLTYWTVSAATTYTLSMLDDGLNNDGEANDGIYGAPIPAQPNGTTVGLYVEAADEMGQRTRSNDQYFYVGQLPLYQPDIVVDNDDGPPSYQEIGAWKTSTSTGYEGGTYRYAIGTSGEPTHSAFWNAQIPLSGVYDVYMAYAAGDNRSAVVPLTIKHADGTSTVTIDQTGSPSLVEHHIGRYPFDAGGDAEIRMDNIGSDDAYIADAVIWHLPADTPPTIELVKRDPAVPAANETVMVTCRAVDNVAITSASLTYEASPPGGTTTIQLFDDGTHGDETASDGIYSAIIPGYPADTAVTFTCTAWDNLGQSTESLPQSYVAGTEPKNVYVVLSSDTSVWGVIGYPGVASWEVFESRTAVLSNVFDERFRYQNVDSLGNPFKLTWFMHGGGWFRTATNSTPISATYHIKQNWADDIERWDDALEYHFHHFVYDEGWKMAPTFEETIWEYEWVMSEMMIEEDIFITSFRSGWNYMDNAYQQYLERWVPFRMEGVRSGWVPYHPSFEDYKKPGIMKGWEVRHHYTKGVSQSLAKQIFQAAMSGTDQVVCIWSHQNEPDFPEQIEAVNANLHAAQAAYPEVQFQYCAADEAMRKWIETDDTTAPPLTLLTEVNGADVHVTINTDDDIYQEQPWVAVRKYDGRCERLDTSKTGTGTWEFSYSKAQYDRIVVGVSDIYGNEAMAEVDDGTFNWTVQSEFANANPINLDIDTQPRAATLQRDGEDDITSGSLSFIHQLNENECWYLIKMDGETPPDTSLQFRYKTAATEPELDQATWSEWISSRYFEFPAETCNPFLNIEVLLQGSESSTPILNSIEVEYGDTETVPSSQTWKTQ